jgi:two-component system, chemotaxis family, chemotaxis protein CheY
VANRPAKFLIVEDSPTMTRMYRTVLGRQGDAELLFAGTGVEGLDRAAQRPDMEMFIVDINMPEMDGLEFLRRLRGELGLTQPALVVSTESEDADREAARDAGADAYLEKPWEPDRLLSAIEDLWERKRG